MAAQLKEVEDSNGTVVNAVSQDKTPTKDQVNAVVTKGRECWNCGRRHEFHKNELCPAYSKNCN